MHTRTATRVMRAGSRPCPALLAPAELQCPPSFPREGLPAAARRRLAPGPSGHPLSSGTAVHLLLGHPMPGDSVRELLLLSCLCSFLTKEEKVLAPAHLLTCFPFVQSHQVLTFPPLSQGSERIGKAQVRSVKWQALDSWSCFQALRRASVPLFGSYVRFEQFGLDEEESFLKENQQIKSGCSVLPCEIWRAQCIFLHSYTIPVSSLRAWAATAMPAVASNSPAWLPKPPLSFLSLNHLLHLTYEWPHRKTKLSLKQSKAS